MKNEMKYWFTVLAIAMVGMFGCVENVCGQAWKLGSDSKWYLLDVSHDGDEITGSYAGDYSVFMPAGCTFTADFTYKFTKCQKGTVVKGYPQIDMYVYAGNSTTDLTGLGAFSGSDIAETTKSFSIPICQSVKAGWIETPHSGKAFGYQYSYGHDCAKKFTLKIKVPDHLNATTTSISLGSKPIFSTLEERITLESFLTTGQLKIKLTSCKINGTNVINDSVIYSNAGNLLTGIVIANNNTVLSPNNDLTQSQLDALKIQFNLKYAGTLSATINISDNKHSIDIPVTAIIVPKTPTIKWGSTDMALNESPKAFSDIVSIKEIDATGSFSITETTSSGGTPSNSKLVIDNTNKTIRVKSGASVGQTYIKADFSSTNPVYSNTSQIHTFDVSQAQLIDCPLTWSQDFTQFFDNSASIDLKSNTWKAVNCVGTAADSYSVADPTIASIGTDGRTLTFHKEGATTITAVKNADATYKRAEISKPLVVANHNGCTSYIINNTSLSATSDYTCSQFSAKPKKVIWVISTNAKSYSSAAGTVYLQTIGGATIDQVSVTTSQNDYTVTTVLPAAYLNERQFKITGLLAASGFSYGERKLTSFQVTMASTFDEIEDNSIVFSQPQEIYQSTSGTFDIATYRNLPGNISAEIVDVESGGNGTWSSFTFEDDSHQTLYVTGGCGGNNQGTAAVQIKFNPVKENEHKARLKVSTFDGESTHSFYIPISGTGTKLSQTLLWDESHDFFSKTFNALSADEELSGVAYTTGVTTTAGVLTVKYSTSDITVAKVVLKNNVPYLDFLKQGSFILYADCDGNDAYHAATQIGTENPIAVSRAQANLSWHSKLDNTTPVFSTQTLDAVTTDSEGDISYSVSGDSRSSVTGKKLAIKSCNKLTVTATKEETDIYAGTSESYSFTPAKVTPGFIWNDDEWSGKFKCGTTYNFTENYDYKTDLSNAGTVPTITYTGDANISFPNSNSSSFEVTRAGTAKISITIGGTLNNNENSTITKTITTDLDITIADKIANTKVGKSSAETSVLTLSDKIDVKGTASVVSNSNSTEFNATISDGVLKVTFRPTTAGERSTIIGIQDNGRTYELTVKATGEKETFDFGSVENQSVSQKQDFKIAYLSYPVTISAANGANSHFEISNNNSQWSRSSVTLASPADEFYIHFAPTDANGTAKSETYTISDGTHSYTIQVSGTAQLATTNLTSSQNIPTSMLTTGANVTIQRSDFTITPAAYNTTTDKNRITYSSNNTSVLKISGNDIVVVGEGKATITATLPALANHYKQSTFDFPEITVTKATPTITWNTDFTQIHDVFAADGSYNTVNLSATRNTTPDGSFTYEPVSTSSDDASISGSTLTIKRHGTIKVKATSDADAKYASATSSIETVKTAKVTPVLTWKQNIPDMTYGVETINLSDYLEYTYQTNDAGYKPDITITTSPDDMLNISGTTIDDITMSVKKVGTLNSITASIDGDTYYFNGVSLTNPNPATFSAHSQTINWTLTSAETAKHVAGNEFELSATSSVAGNTVSYSSHDDNVATVDDDGVLHCVAPGLVKITAYNNAAGYERAEKSYVFTVSPAGFGSVDVLSNGIKTFLVSPGSTVDQIDAPDGYFVRVTNATTPNAWSKQLQNVSDGTTIDIKFQPHTGENEAYNDYVTATIGSQSIQIPVTGKGKTKSYAFGTRYVLTGTTTKSSTLSTNFFTSSTSTYSISIPDDDTDDAATSTDAFLVSHNASSARYARSHSGLAQSTKFIVGFFPKNYKTSGGYSSSAFIVDSDFPSIQYEIKFTGTPKDSTVEVSTGTQIGTATESREVSLKNFSPSTKTSTNNGNFTIKAPDHFLIKKTTGTGSATWATQLTNMTNGCKFHVMFVPDHNCSTSEAYIGDLVVHDNNPIYCTSSSEDYHLKLKGTATAAPTISFDEKTAVGSTSTETEQFSLTNFIPNGDLTVEVYNQNNPTNFVVSPDNTTTSAFDQSSCIIPSSQTTKEFYVKFKPLSTGRHDEIIKVTDVTTGRIYEFNVTAASFSDPQLEWVTNFTGIHTFNSSCNNNVITLQASSSDSHGDISYALDDSSAPYATLSGDKLTINQGGVYITVSATIAESVEDFKNETTIVEQFYVIEEHFWLKASDGSQTKNIDIDFDTVNVGQLPVKRVYIHSFSQRNQTMSIVETENNKTKTGFEDNFGYATVFPTEETCGHYGTSDPEDIYYIDITFHPYGSGRKSGKYTITAGNGDVATINVSGVARSLGFPNTCINSRESELTVRQYTWPSGFDAKGKVVTPTGFEVEGWSTDQATQKKVWGWANTADISESTFSVRFNPKSYNNGKDFEGNISIRDTVENQHYTVYAWGLPVKANTEINWNVSQQEQTIPSNGLYKLDAKHLRICSCDKDTSVINDIQYTIANISIFDTVKNGNDLYLRAKGTPGQSSTVSASVSGTIDPGVFTPSSLDPVQYTFTIAQEQYIDWSDATLLTIQTTDVAATMTAAAKDKSYNQPTGATITYDCIGDNCGNVSKSGSTLTFSDEGTYTIRATASSINNFAEVTQDRTFVVRKAGKSCPQYSLSPQHITRDNNIQFTLAGKPDKMNGLYEYNVGTTRAAHISDQSSSIWNVNDGFSWDVGSKAISDIDMTGKTKITVVSDNGAGFTNGHKITYLQVSQKTYFNEENDETSKSISFGDCTVGQESTGQTVTFEYSNIPDLKVTCPDVDSVDFTYSRVITGGSLVDCNCNGKITYTFKFAPQSKGFKSATFTFKTYIGGSEQTFQLTVTGNALEMPNLQWTTNFSNTDVLLSDGKYNSYTLATSSNSTGKVTYSLDVSVQAGDAAISNENILTVYKADVPVKVIAHQDQKDPYGSKDIDYTLTAVKVTPEQTWTMTGALAKYGDVVALKDVMSYYAEGAATNVGYLTVDDTEFASGDMLELLPGSEGYKFDQCSLRVAKAGQLNSITLKTALMQYYYDANKETKSLSITFAKAPNTITWTDVSELTIGNAYDIKTDIVTSTRNEDSKVDRSDITYSANDPDIATASGSTLNLLKAGVMNISITDNGDADHYDAATGTNTKTLIVNPSYRITFGDLLPNETADEVINLSSVIKLKGSVQRIYTSNSVFKVLNPANNQYVVATSANPIDVTGQTSVKVQFAPTATGEYTGVLNVEDDISGTIYTIKIEIYGKCWNPSVVTLVKSSTVTNVEIGTTSAEYDLGTNTDINGFTWASGPVTITSSNPFVFRVYEVGKETTNCSAVTGDRTVSVDYGISQIRIKYVPEAVSASAGENGIITIRYMLDGQSKAVSLPLKGYGVRKTIAFNTVDIGTFPEEKFNLDGMVSNKGYTVSSGNNVVFRIEKATTDYTIAGYSTVAAPAFNVEFYPTSANASYNDSVTVTDKSTGRTYKIEVTATSTDVNRTGDCGTALKGDVSTTTASFQISGSGLPSSLTDFAVNTSNNNFYVTPNDAHSGSPDYVVSFTPQIKQSADITGTINLIDNTNPASPILYPVYSVKGKCNTEVASIRCNQVLNNLTYGGNTVQLSPYLVDIEGTIISTNLSEYSFSDDCAGANVNASGLVTTNATGTTTESGNVTITISKSGYTILPLLVPISVAVKATCYAVNDNTVHTGYLNYSENGFFSTGGCTPTTEFAPPTDNCGENVESSGWQYNVAKYGNVYVPLGNMTVSVTRGSTSKNYQINIRKQDGSLIGSFQNKSSYTKDMGAYSVDAFKLHLYNYSSYFQNWPLPLRGSDYKVTVNSVQILQAQYLKKSVDCTSKTFTATIGQSVTEDIEVEYSAWEAIQCSISAGGTNYTLPQSTVYPPQCGCGKTNIPVTFTPAAVGNNVNGTLSVTGTGGTVFTVQLKGTVNQRNQTIIWSSSQATTAQFGSGNVTLSASSSVVALKGEVYNSQVLTTGAALPVTYLLWDGTNEVTEIPGKAKIVNGNELQLLGAGLVTVRAKQTGTNFTNEAHEDLYFTITQDSRSVVWNNTSLVVTSATPDIALNAYTIDKNKVQIPTADEGDVTYSIISASQIPGQSLNCVALNGKTLEINGSGSATIEVSFANSQKYENTTQKWILNIADTVPGLEITPPAAGEINSTSENIDMLEYIALKNYTDETVEITVSDPTDVTGVVSISDGQYLKAYKDIGSINVPCTVKVTTRWLADGSNPVNNGYITFSISKGTLYFDVSGGGKWTDYTKWTRPDIIQLHPKGDYSDFHVVISDSCFIGEGEADAETEADFLTHTVNAACYSLSITDDGKAKVVVGEASTLKVVETFNNANADRFLLTANYWGQASVVFNNGAPKATIEMYVPEGNGSRTDPVWQYRGVAVDGFEMAGGPWNCMAIYRWDEAGNNNYQKGCWNVVTNGGVTSGLSLKPWVGYAFANMCAAPYDTATWLTYKGTLINTTKDTLLSYHRNTRTTNASDTFDNVGINLITNSFAVPLNIANLGYPADSEKGVILYNAGSHTDYRTAGGNVGNQRGNKGQYSTVPKNTGGPTTDIITIPSGQGFFVKAVHDKEGADHTLHINYGNDFYTIAPSDRMYMPALGDEPEFNILKINVISNKDSVSDRLYLVECETCTRHFDNGYDGKKMIGDEGLPQLYAYNKFGITAVNADSTFNKQYIGFNAGSDDESYTISFETDKLFGYHSLYLVDRKQNQSVDILAGETYTFKGYSVGENMRFQINGVTEEEWQNQDPNDDDDNDQSICDLRVIGGQLYVQGFTTFDYPAATIELFDMTGNLVWSTPLTAERLYDLPSLPHGVYTIRLGDCHVKLSSMR